MNTIDAGIDRNFSDDNANANDSIREGCLEPIPFLGAMVRPIARTAWIRLAESLMTEIAIWTLPQQRKD
jgi:hypothetical protein